MERIRAKAGESKASPIIDYARPDAGERSLVPGRAALSCIVASLLLYGVLLAFVPDDSETLVNVMCDALLLLFAAGSIISIVAVARRKSRTISAWIAFAIATAWWLFYFAAFFGGM
jgi:peptidoglycan/LPS O-acetylase OafA/YrhL